MPGQHIPPQERELLNGVLRATREIRQPREDQDSGAIPTNESVSLLLVRQAQSRRALFEATQLLVDYWRKHETMPELEVARDRLMEAAASIKDLGALHSWLSEDIRQCEALRQRMIGEPGLMETETFFAMVRSQLESGEAPFADLRAAALHVAATVDALSAAQQQWAMKAGADQQGIRYAEEVRDDGTRVLSFDFSQRQRQPWWRRMIRRNGG